MHGDIEEVVNVNADVDTVAFSDGTFVKLTQRDGVWRFELLNGGTLYGRIESSEVNGDTLVLGDGLRWAVVGGKTVYAEDGAR